MKGIDFKEANAFAGTQIFAEGNLTPLRVYTDGQACLSVWELSDEDIQNIVKTRKLQVIVYARPHRHPAIGLTTEDALPKNPLIVNP